MSWAAASPSSCSNRLIIINTKLILDWDWLKMNLNNVRCEFKFKKLCYPQKAICFTASKELDKKTPDNNRQMINTKCKQSGTRGLKIWFKRPVASGTQEFLCPFVLHLGSRIFQKGADGILTSE